MVFLSQSAGGLLTAISEIALAQIPEKALNLRQMVVKRMSSVLSRKFRFIFLFLTYSFRIIILVFPFSFFIN